MKEIKKVLTKISMILLTSIMLIGTLTVNMSTPVNTKALYDDTGALVGHGYDALSTKNGLNPPDKGGVNQDIFLSLPDEAANWQGGVHVTSQNGDVLPGTPYTRLYPGETMHIHYELMFKGSTEGNVTAVYSDDFIRFRKDLFGYLGGIKVESTNPNTNPQLTFVDYTVGGRVVNKGVFNANEMLPGDKITIDFDVQTVLDLKEQVLATNKKFPFNYTINTILAADYESSNTVSLNAGLLWTQSETPIPVSKRVTNTTNKNVDETPTHPIVDLTGDEVEYEIELNNNVSGSMFAQIVKDSLFEKLPSIANDIKLTSIERIHQKQNPLVDYVELSMDKGIPITTNSVATQAQLDAVTEKLKAGTFVIDEIQEGDKVLIKYKVTVPKVQDSDGDGVSDQKELFYAAQGMDPMNACSLSGVQAVPNPDEDPSDPTDDMIQICTTPDGQLDSDNDGRTNAEETVNDLDPFNSDENHNGIIDGQESFKIGLNNDFIYDKKGSKKSTTTPYSGYPTVKKTSVTSNGDKLIEPGEKVKYTIELANFTSGIAYNIPVRDSLYETLSNGSQYGFSLIPGYTVVDSSGNVLTTSGDLANGTLKIEKLPVGEKAKLVFSTQASSNLEELVGNGSHRLTNIVTIDGTTPTTSNNANGKYSPTDAKASDPIIQAGTIELHKVDKDTRTPLSDAEFVVYNQVNQPVKTLKTDANGNVKAMLPLGDYTLQEIKAPAGYEVDSTRIPFKLDTPNQVLTKTIDNTKSVGQIEIIKQDKADGTKLAGAVFEIHDDAGNLKDTLITDPTGKATSINLPLGNYILVETIAPVGYEKDPTPIPVTLTTHGVTITKTIDNTKSVGQIEIIKQDKADNTKLAGAEFDVKDAKGVVTHLTTGKDGKALSGNLPLGDYTLVETKAPAGYELDPTPIPVTLTTHGVTITKTIDNTKSVGQIEIIKQDKADNTKLAGAEFDVKDAKGVVTHLTTGKDGKALSGNLPLGDYTLVETKAPAGYELDATPIPVTLTTHGVTVTKTIDNTKSVGQIEIIKQDKADGTKLAGAEFDVKDANGVVTHLITGNDGKAISSNLPLGAYTLVETKAPVGYDLDATPIPVTLTTNGLTVTKTIDNTKTPVVPQVGQIEIIKQDKADGTKLAGAEFDVKDANGVVTHLVTGNDGKVISSNLPLGAYTLVETKAPVGYDLDATPIPVTLTTTGLTVTKAIDNTKTPVVPQVGQIEIIKQDKADGTKLAGAVFEIRDGAGILKDTLITDPTGKAKSINLPLGNYDLVETIAPMGYDLDATLIPVVLTTNGKVVTKTIDNTKTPVVPQVGQIEIIKQDKADGTKLAGAEFDVKDANGVVTHLITGNDGKVISSNLPLGAYTLVETKAPVGYDLDVTPIPVTLTTTGQVVTKAIDNTKTPVVPQVGQIEITKQDKVNQSLKLVGAEFDVKDVSGVVVDHVVTPATGIIKTKSLPLGTYMLVETKAPAGYALDTTPIKVTIANQNQVIAQKVDNEKLPPIVQSGQIEITKQDKVDGTKLAGAEFDVRNSSGTVVDHVVTPATGIVTTKMLPLGTYTLVETKAPNGYMLDTTLKTITLTTANQVVKQAIDNVKSPLTVGKIEVTKQDKADGTKLAGAEFDVRNSSGTVVDHIVTNAQGVAISKELPLGMYTLVETKAPNGYMLDATPKTVTLTVAGQSVKQTVDNTKVAPSLGKIAIIKQDAATKVKLAGAEFDVKDAKGTVVAHLVTDGQGNAMTNGLPLGTYTITETKAPNGYVIDITPLTVKIEAQDQIIKQTINNTVIPVEEIKFSGIEITKQDKMTKAKLAGAEFDIKDNKGTVVNHVVTDENGYAMTKSLPLGTYTIIETKAPEGYKLDSTEISVIAKTQDELVKVTIDNEKLTPPVDPETPKPNTTPKTPTVVENVDHLPDTGNGAQVNEMFISFGLVFIFLLGALRFTWKQK